jgi:hypothetical protein
MGSRLVAHKTWCLAFVKAHPRRRRCLSHSIPAPLTLVQAPKPGNKHQDVREHEPRHGDLGHLERHVTAWRTTFAPILISYSRRLISDHDCAVFGIASVRMKLPRL